jgi:hypothetical protein
MATIERKLRLGEVSLSALKTPALAFPQELTCFASKSFTSSRPTHDIRIIDLTLDITMPAAILLSCIRTTYLGTLRSLAMLQYAKSLRRSYQRTDCYRVSMVTTFIPCC